MPSWIGDNIYEDDIYEGDIVFWHPEQSCN
jgi:hypothetical protein